MKKKKSKTDFFKRLGLKLRDSRRKRNFIFEDMPNITGLTSLKVMLLESGKKELYTWSLSELWSYLDKMGYDLRIDALPREQDENTPTPNTWSLSCSSATTKNVILGRTLRVTHGTTGGEPNTHRTSSLAAVKA